MEACYEVNARCNKSINGKFYHYSRGMGFLSTTCPIHRKILSYSGSENASDKDIHQECRIWIIRSSDGATGDKISFFFFLELLVVFIRCRLRTPKYRF